MFFDGRPLALSLYETLLNRIRSEIGDTDHRVQKTQITFFSRRVFACVSMMRVRRKSELPPEFIVVTFGLHAPVDSPRIAARTEPHPNRWTHHVVISRPEEIDGELMGWLREAHALSSLK